MRDVVVAVRVIGVVPVHPLAEPDGLFGDRCSAAVYARAARTRELVDAVRFDVALAVQVELALHLDLDPQPLAVEPVLPALVESLHRLVALVEFLIGASPGVVDAHRLDVRRDRAVDEGVPRAAGVLLSQRLKAPVALPQLEHAVLELRKVERRPHRRESRFLVRRGHALLRSRPCRANKNAVPLPGRRVPWYHPSWHACARPLIASLTEWLSGRV